MFSRDTEVQIIAQRFVKPVSEDFVQRIAESSIPTLTRRKMNRAEMVWTTWLSSRSEDDVSEVHRKTLSKKLFKVDNVSLQWLLQCFVLEVRIEKGKHYPPETLYGLCLSLQKVVIVCGQRMEWFFFCILNSTNLHKCLTVKWNVLWKLGIGTVRRQAAALSSMEEEKLWLLGALWSATPQQLHTITVNSSESL